MGRIEETIKMCEECNKPCELIRVQVKPSSSEWYCSACHRSYPIWTDEEIEERKAAATARRAARS